jgi:hypothetical protein
VTARIKDVDRLSCLTDSHGYQGRCDEETRFGCGLCSLSGAPVASWKEGSKLTTTRLEPRVSPETEPLAKPNPVLLRAARLVRERGLCQGPWRAGGPLCAAGAVGVAAGHLGFSRTEMEGVVLRFARSLGGSAAGDVHSWNDTSGRSAGEVAEALERAAYGL